MLTHQFLYNDGKFSIFQQNIEIKEIISGANKLNANNKKVVDEYISNYGTILSHQIELKESISDAGASGVVYRGMKDDYMEVAVKVINVVQAKNWNNSKDTYAHNQNA